MKVLYILIIIIILTILGMIYYYSSPIQYNFTLLEKSNNKNKFKFIDNNNLALDDDFGNIIKEPFQNNNIQEYIESFEKSITHTENFNQEQQIKLLPPTITPRYVWTYWENKEDRTEPFAHIKLCFTTMKKYYGKYNFIILTPDTIKNYLPNDRTDLNDLMIAQKVDYYRVALLYLYGGIWIDADTIALQHLDSVFEKLDNGYDFVGFGCTGKICYNGYPDPSNGVMGSRKNGILMNYCLNKLNTMLNAKNTQYTYFELGKNVIWKCMDELQNYNYYHFPSEYDGSRDYKGQWIHTPNHLSETSTKLLNEDRALFIFLANYEIMNDQQNVWFTKLSENEILNGKWWISSLYRKALQ